MGESSGKRAIRKFERESFYFEKERSTQVPHRSAIKNVIKGSRESCLTVTWSYLILAAVGTFAALPVSVIVYKRFYCSVVRFVWFTRI